MAGPFAGPSSPAPRARFARPACSLAPSRPLVQGVVSGPVLSFLNRVPAGASQPGPPSIPSRKSWLSPPGMTLSSAPAVCSHGSQRLGPHDAGMGTLKKPHLDKVASCNLPIKRLDLPSAVPCIWTAEPPAQTDSQQTAVLAASSGEPADFVSGGRIFPLLCCWVDLGVESCEGWLAQ